jgi:hypothetical protein
MRRSWLACTFAIATTTSACSSSDGGTTNVDARAGDSAIVVDAAADVESDRPTGEVGDDARIDASTDAPIDVPIDATTKTRVYGVTTDSIDALPDIVASLSALPHRPTTRIVFDEVPASTYLDAARQIHVVSDVMGELMDSFYMKNFTLDQSNARTDEYLLTLWGEVDVWEIGNEINGDWLGDTASVVAKVTSTFEKVRAKAGKTALTLYWFEPTCLPDAAHEMFGWVDANVPASMKDGLDWVLVSYYEEDCGGARPDWPTIFHRLALAFPKSKIGFGEVGIKDPASKAAYLARYYGTAIDEPSWIGGHFWWYFHQDMVPKTQPLFTVLATAMATEP